MVQTHPEALTTDDVHRETMFRELERFTADLGAAVSKRMLEALMRMTEYEKRLLFWLGIIVAIALTWNITTAYLL
jgi:hypothetical protein